MHDSALSGVYDLGGTLPLLAVDVWLSDVVAFGALCCGCWPAAAAAATAAAVVDAEDGITRRSSVTLD